MHRPTALFDAPRPRRSLISMVLLVAALALVATACGDDDETDAADPVTTAAPDPTADPDATDTVDSAIEEFQDEVTNGLGDTADDATATAEEVAVELRDNGATVLADLVERIDMSDVTDSRGFTFFAPNDEAFRALDQDDFAALLDDPGRIIDVLRSHVVTERLSAAQLAERSTVEAASGELLEIGERDGDITVDNAQVVRADVGIGVGVVHVVDMVLTL